MSLFFKEKLSVCSFQGTNIMGLRLSFYPMGSSGLEPPTSRVSGVRSNQLSDEPIPVLRLSGEYEIRTRDLLLARQALSQLS